MQRRLGTFTVLAMVALLGAGCSNDSPEEATGGDGSSESTTTTLDVHEQGVTYAACMREHGVPDFPDPDPTGEFPNYGVSVTPEVFTGAVDACQDLQPASVDYSAERTPEEQSAALRFAQCMRENGVPDFPDPVDGEPLINTYEIPSSNSEGGMAILDAAIATCGDVLGDSTGGSPEEGDGG